MTPEFAYFLKVNVAFVLLYAFYRLFFYKDTFFRLRRAILLAFFGLSILYPLMNIQDWVKGQEPMVEVINMYSAILPEAEVIIAPPVIQQTNWQELFKTSLFYIYWAGVIALFIRFIAQFCSILYLAHKSRKMIIHGVPVHILDKSAGPFSFFQLIFLHPGSHSDKEVDEILTHECTHVFQWHSIDVIICELVNIVCWVNPFAWLLKREVRHNLEYLADDTVLESGYDSKSYQYHLLGLAHNKSTAALYNSFNVLHLKNRISMMNKKRSRGIGRAKYLVFIPVAGCMMLLSNIDALARITNKITDEVSVESFLPQNDKVIKVKAQVVDEFRKPVVGASVIVKGTTTGTVTDTDGMFALEAPENATLQLSYIDLETREIDMKNIQENMKIQMLTSRSGKTTSDDSEQIFTVVEVMPEFPGGNEALFNYLSENIKYPVVAQEKGIQGRVSCQFTVRKDGSITDAKVVRGVDPALDKEALRLIINMPKWKPGTQRGHKVSVQYTVPVIFRLVGGNASASSSSQDAENIDSSTAVFTMVEDMPRFPGGNEKLLTFLKENVSYPTSAQQRGVQGRVSCQFIVDRDGTLRDIEVVRGIDEELDKEAVRVISIMPKWEPGKQRGKAVKVKYTVPITFSLN